MSEFVIPDNVKEVLARLSVADQVVIRSYIAGMRDQLKEYKAKAEHGEHAHYHGDELCTSDHGHSHNHHGDADMACADKECGSHDHGHGHDHHEHKHEHAHHHDHKKESHDHDHKHHSEHEHDHDHKKEDDIPAWKKRALESGGDATAAPFGGSWNTESSLDATK